MSKNPEHISFHILCITFCLANIYLDIPLFRNLKKLHLKKKKLDIMKKYMKNKDFYTLEIENPTTKETFEFPILNLSSIDQFLDMKSFDDYTGSLTLEEKEKEREAIQQLLFKRERKEQ